MQKGSCHCGAIEFEFNGPKIEAGVRCNCSICIRKGTTMSNFVVAESDLRMTIKNEALATYQFGSKVAKHHFCRHCGIYTFHQTLRKPGHYRLNLGCVEGVDILTLPFEVFDGASL